MDKITKDIKKAFKEAKDEHNCKYKDCSLKDKNKTLDEFGIYINGAL